MSEWKEYKNCIYFVFGLCLSFVDQTSVSHLLSDLLLIMCDELGLFLFISYLRTFSYDCL